MVNVNELRKQKLQDVRKKFDELQKDIAAEVFNIEARKSTKTAQLRAMKKDLARIATIMNELVVIQSLNENEKAGK